MINLNTNVANANAVVSTNTATNSVANVAVKGNYNEHSADWWSATINVDIATSLF